MLESRSWFPTSLRLIAVTLAVLVTALPAYGVDEVSHIQVAPEQKWEGFRPRRLALFLGVESFVDPEFRPLKFASKDVADFRAFLALNNASPGDSDVVLTNEHATAARLVQALDELEAKNTSEDDVILIYLSSHGTLAYDAKHALKPYVALHETRFSAVSDTGVPLDFLERRLSRMKSRRKALVLALCHSGFGKSHLPSTVEAELTGMKGEFFPQPLHEVSSALMILSASAWGQAAREDPVLANDIYTHFLLEGLNVNDANGDGAISLFEAHEFARSKTYDYTRGQQTPSAIVSFEGVDPIILNGAVRRKARPMIVADSDQFRDLRLALDGQTKGSLWQPQPGLPGRVRLTLVDPRNPETPIVDHQVYLQEGKSYTVSSLIARPPSVAIEMGALQMAVPAGVIPRQASWAPGLTVRAFDLFATTATAAAGYFSARGTQTRTLDFEPVDTAFEVDLLRVGGGVAFYPRRTFGTSLSLYLDYLTVERTLANDTLASPRQKAQLVYPTVAAEARALGVVRNLYVGLGVEVHPWRAARLQVDGSERSLRWVTGAGFLGASF